MFPVGLAATADPQPGFNFDYPALAIGMFATFLAVVACAAWPNWHTARRSSRATAARRRRHPAHPQTGDRQPTRGRSRDRVDRIAFAGPRQGWQHRSVENDVHGSGDRSGRPDGRHRLLGQPHAPRGHTEALRGHVGCADRVRVGRRNAADAGTPCGTSRPGNRRGLNGVFRRSGADPGLASTRWLSTLCAGHCCSPRS